MTRLPAWRSAVGLTAVVLCATVLASRIRSIANEPRVSLGPRVAQLMYTRMLALRIDAYARRYGRPAYYLDSVEVHLDSADRQLVADLRTDLWGRPVGYFWTWCGFRVWSDVGGWTPRSGAEPDSAWQARHGMRLPGSISEDHPWPRGVGRTHDCFGNP